MTAGGLRDTVRDDHNARISSAGSPGRFRRRIVAGTVLALALCVAAVAARWVTTPIDRLRDRLVYRPSGAPTTREAGLGVPTNVALDQVPEILLVSLLFNEDKKFFEHHGFDLGEIRTSISEWVGGERRLRGASTVTQQLARTFFRDRRRTIRRKLVEAIDTVKLERSFTKDEILVLYLNNVDWGPGVYGIASAATHYFKRTPGELQPMECVFLAAILPSPVRLAAGVETWRIPPATAVRMQRLLDGVRSAVEAAADGQPSDDPGPRLVAAVRGARERAHARRAGP